MPDNNKMFRKSNRNTTSFFFLVTLMIQFVFNCNNFEENSGEVYPKDLTLVRTDTFDNISFPDLKIKINNGKWFIGL